ncbi:MAG: ABC transporter permease, partial [Chloroflexota bacterium]
EDIRVLQKLMGLDKPHHERYLFWLLGAVQGDLGISMWTRTPVMEEIWKALPVSLELTILSTVLSVIIAIPAGFISAVRQNTWMDYGSRLASIWGLAIPHFWLATLLLFYPSVMFGYNPPVVYIPFFDDPLHNLEQFALPAFSMGVYYTAIVMRMTRSCMLEVLRQDYIRTAWSKGLREGTILIRHAFKNASIPVITLVGFEFGRVLAGTIVIETVFTLPGLGRLTFDAIGWRDYTQLSGNLLTIAAIFLIVNLLVDLLYGVLDPRIRYQ